VSLAEKRLDGLLREMAMAGADVDHQRVGGRRRPRQGLAQPGIDRLAHEVFDHGAMGRRLLGHGHAGEDLGVVLKIVKQFLAKSFKLFQICANGYGVETTKR
jgi:hypothetical protein